MTLPQQEDPLQRGGPKPWGQCDSCFTKTQHLHERMVRINRDGEREIMHFCLACDGEDTSGKCRECWNKYLYSGLEK